MIFLNVISLKKNSNLTDQSEKCYQLIHPHLLSLGFLENSRSSRSEVLYRCSKIFKNTFFIENLRNPDYCHQCLKDHREISLLMLSEFKRINYLLLPLKSSENLRFSDDFRGNRS